MRKSKKVQGPHFEVSPELGVRWDRMMRRLGRGACTRLLSTMMEEVLKQLEKPKEEKVGGTVIGECLKCGLRIDVDPLLDRSYDICDDCLEVYGDKGKVELDNKGSGGEQDVSRGKEVVEGSEEFNGEQQTSLFDTRRDD